MNEQEVVNEHSKQNSTVVVSTHPCAGPDHPEMFCTSPGSSTDFPQRTLFTSAHMIQWSNENMNYRLKFSLPDLSMLFTFKPLTPTSYLWSMSITFSNCEDWNCLKDYIYTLICHNKQASSLRPSDAEKAVSHTAPQGKQVMSILGLSLLRSAWYP